MNPTVSVIVPNYNYASFLAQRLDSILAQTFTDFEVIILDDHSTDNSREVIESYRNHPRISRIVYNTENSGSPFVQWNRGVELAVGEWIWIAESDDYADRHFLKCLMDEVDHVPNAVIAFSHSHFVDVNGNDLGYNAHAEHGDKIEVYDGQHFVKRKMLWRNYIFNASMTIFKKSVYLQVDKSFTHYRSCGDWLLWTNICLKGDVIECFNLLNSFRQHNNSTTAKAGKVGNDWREVSEILHEFAQSQDLSPLLRRCFRGQWTKHLRESNCHDKAELVDLYPDVYGGTNLDVLCYEISKIPIKIKQWKITKKSEYVK